MIGAYWLWNLINASNWGNTLALSSVDKLSKIDKSLLARSLSK